MDNRIEDRVMLKDQSQERISLLTAELQPHISMALFNPKQQNR